MTSKSIQRIDYDDKNDVLYISFVVNSMSYGDEYGGVVIMKDMKTDDITGLTILSPKTHRSARERDLKEVYAKEGLDFHYRQLTE